MPTHASKCIHPPFIESSGLLHCQWLIHFSSHPYVVVSLRTPKGRTVARPRVTRSPLSPSGCHSGDGLLDRCIEDFVRLYPRRTLNHGRQHLRHFWVSSAVVGFRMFRALPETEGMDFFSTWV